MLAIAAAAVLAADIYVHHRLSKYAAVNVWGYRGEVLGRKQPGEKRIFMIGPSTVFGVGFPPEDALPAQLERQLQQRVPHPVRVVNLGMPGEDAYAYRATIEDYRYLKPDAVIFYGDSNITGESAPIVLRHQSPIFRWTGYSPILHIALRERFLMWRHDGKIQEAYDDKVVFRPGDKEAGGLKAAADVADFMKSTEAASASPAAPPSCEKEFKNYCTSMNNAVTYARSLGLPALVVNQPYETPFQVHIQNALRQMLRDRHGNDAGVRYLDMGYGIDLKDSTLTYDGVHLTPAGNAKMASQLLEPALELLAAAGRD